MKQQPANHYVTRQLQLVFTFSIIILLISAYASFYSNNKLIESSRLVNHTNEVMIQAEMLLSIAKDAETGQRGFVITSDPEFLEPYNGAYDKAIALYNNLRDLTTDNPEQQRNLVQAREILDQRFAQMVKVLRAARSHTNDTRGLAEESREEMERGKLLMDRLRSVVDQIKGEEKRLMAIRIQEQKSFIRYTPVFVIAAAVVSVLISLLAYLRIKKDLDERIQKQQEDEAQYRSTTQRISRMEAVTGQIASGNYSVRSNDPGGDDLGKISTALNAMAASLEENFNLLTRNNWLQAGAISLAASIRGERRLRTLGDKIVAAVAQVSDAYAGTLYVVGSATAFKLSGTYGASSPPEWVMPGDGLVGQAIADGQIRAYQNLPASYLRIQSSLSEGDTPGIVVVPLSYNDEVIAVMELGLLASPGHDVLAFLEQSREPIAVGINAVLSYERTQELLEETQAQAEELQAQHNELENLNTELEAQAQKLQASEEELKVQQEELLQSNQELEERSRLLEERNQLIAERNLEIQRKAEELEISTRYKSEFLANMSHELRTPLNSILLLSRLLSENHKNNLSPDQVEYAHVIQSSGTGLLSLIDEILDLSKIEAGKMELEYDDVELSAIGEEMRRLFAPVAADKHIAFDLDYSGDIPAHIRTDKMRLEQILRNLISNAIKFTPKGSVRLIVGRAEQPGMIAFTVEDSGIGIPKEKQQLIFEAFQQADGSTRRKFGGTGLGLSISRELARLLGGSITLKSEPDQGSAFTLILPEEKMLPEPGSAPTEMTSVPMMEQVVKIAAADAPYAAFIASEIPEGIPDDRNSIATGDSVLLIVEDDTAFAKALLAFARSKGYKGIVSVRGDEAALLAQHYKPAGILLDVQLPVKSGWEVMEELKAEPRTRHIPVHIMSSHTVKKESMMRGAIDFINKPVTLEKMQDIFSKIEYVLGKENKKVLIIEENTRHARALAYFLGSYQVNTQISENINEGLAALHQEEVDCVILDMGIPDASIYLALEKIRDSAGLENLPIIVFTGKNLSKPEEERLRQYADTIVVKTAHSYRRILDEVSIFLHLMEEHKSEKGQRNPGRLGTLNEVLRNKKILITDDDVRNIFSLTKALEMLQMNVFSATDGKEALRVLEAEPDMDVVLMDIMMPEMDGYETMKRIRAQMRFRQLPVIAVTAKAMLGDRDKCIQAGASDYISKPVDVDQLVSLLRVWLYDKL